MKPLALTALQGQFQDFLLDPAQDETGIAKAIAPQPGLPVSDRLAIYYHAYRIRLREALDESFSKTGVYLGDDLFALMAERYVAAHPSCVQNLRWYGQQFPTFLAQELDAHPQVADLAAFEWALGLAFDAEDAPVLCADDMRQLVPEAWAGVSFTLQPSAQILPMHYNAVALWLALDKDEEPPEAVRIDPPAQWLIWRRDFQPQFRSISAFESHALQEVRRGFGFAAVCATGSERADGDNAEVQLADCLRAWLHEGVLSRFHTG
jgi:hypothetical protein